MSVKSVDFNLNNQVFAEDDEKQVSQEKRKTIADLCLDTINNSCINEELVLKCNKKMKSINIDKIRPEDILFLREVALRAAPEINVSNVNALFSLIKENEQLIKDQHQLKSILNKLITLESRKKIEVNSNPYAYSDD